MIGSCSATSAIGSRAATPTVPTPTAPAISPVFDPKAPKNPCRSVNPNVSNLLIILPNLLILQNNRIFVSSYDDTFLNQNFTQNLIKCS